MKKFMTSAFIFLGLCGPVIAAGGYDSPSASTGSGQIQWAMGMTGCISMYTSTGTKTPTVIMCSSGGVTSIYGMATNTMTVTGLMRAASGYFSQWANFNSSISVSGLSGFGNGIFSGWLVTQGSATINGSIFITSASVADLSSSGTVAAYAMVTNTMTVNGLLRGTSVYVSQWANFNSSITVNGLSGFGNGIFSGWLVARGSATIQGAVFIASASVADLSSSGTVNAAGFAGNGRLLTNTIALDDEGAFVSNGSTVNCVGGGITCTASGQTLTFTVPTPAASLAVATGTPQINQSVSVTTITFKGQGVQIPPGTIAVATVTINLGTSTAIQNLVISTISGDGNQVQVVPFDGAIPSFLNIMGVQFNNFSATASLAVTGLNGIDTGTELGNTWYYFYAICNDSGTLTGGLLTTTTTVQPTMPTSYTKWRRVATVHNNGSSNITGFIKKGNITMYSVGQEFLETGTMATGWTKLDLSQFMPPTATYIFCQVTVDDSVAAFNDDVDIQITPLNYVTGGSNSNKIGFYIQTSATARQFFTQFGFPITTSIPALQYQAISGNVGGYVGVIAFMEDY